MDVYSGSFRMECNFSAMSLVFADEHLISVSIPNILIAIKLTYKYTKQNSYCFILVEMLCFCYLAIHVIRITMIFAQSNFNKRSYTCRHFGRFQLSTFESTALIIRKCYVTQIFPSNINDISHCVCVFVAAK